MRALVTSLLVLLLGLLPAPSPAAPLDDARAAAAAAAADFERARAERQALDAAHEALAVEIEALKAADTPLPGVRDPRLDDRLKRARALAEQLAALDRAVAEARSAVEARGRALLEQLDAALIARRLALAEAPAIQRRALFEELRHLIEERQALTRALASRPARPPALPAPPTDEMASPDELRELADETRDHAEQVQSRLAMLEERLAGLRERQRLVQAATAFSRDDALFAQDERNRQLVRREDGVAAATPTGRPARGDTTDGDEIEVGDGGGSESPEGALPPEASPDGADAPDNDSADPQAGFESGDGQQFDDQPGRSDGLGAEITPPPEALPVGGVDPQAGSPGATFVEEAFDPTRLDALDDLSPEALARRIEAIEARRAQLERRRAKLEARGRTLEKRARDLESEDP